MAKKKVKKSYRPTPQAFAASKKAMLGNEWYKLRSKHGRDRLFATPQLLWEAACEYFNIIDGTPLHDIKTMVVKGKVVQQKVPLRKPYQWRGLCLYLGCSHAYFRAFRATCKDVDFLTVVSLIEDVIYTQKFEGAAAGQFNSLMISRDLGLRENVDTTSNGKAIVPPAFNIYNTGPELAASEKEVEERDGE